MSQHPEHGRNLSRRRDAGFTLPELLIAVMISGILVVSISMAFTTVLRTQSQATDRLAESKDITFVQTWLPVDLSSALDTFSMPDEAELAADLAAGTPSMAFNATLPGVNVLTVIRPDLEAGSGIYYLVAYRYHEVGGQWQMSRFEIRNPGTASEVVKTVGVAYEMPEPPVGWDITQAPVHAVEVTSRNQVILRPIGEDVKVNFESGNDFRTGGAGLSAENQLPTDYSGGFTDPSAPPSRCGGRVALVIDTSGSVPAGNGDEATKDAAEGFIRGFTGTPTTLSLNGFDMEGYGMGTVAGAKVSNGSRAPFLSLLNPGPTVESLVTRVTDLENFGPPSWPGARGGPARQALRDYVNDGIHWDQIYDDTGSGTNWEDGLFNVIYRSDGTPYGIEQPSLVVFVTDGEPNRVRTASGGSSDAGNVAAKNAAAVIANDLRAQGARTIGVMVGNKSNNGTYVGYLKDVVGTIEWNGSVNGDGTINVGNAATADLFKGEFESLGPILRSILIAECGGTLTMQKRIDTGTLENPASGQWSYTTDLGVRELDRSKTSSITFDYSFATGEVSKQVQIVEAPAAGYVWDRAECSADGNPVAAVPNVDGSPGATVTVQADQAVSCLMISRPA